MLYKQKNDITAWLASYGIKNYTLRADDTYGYVVDVGGNVHLGSRGLYEIEVKFGTINGNLWVNNNHLTSLAGCPDEIIKNFWCNDNQLKTLEGSPKHVGGSMWCNNNSLTSLKGLPETVVRAFFHGDNPGLGELQDLKTFAELKCYMFSQKLSHELNNCDNKTKKIKI